MLMLLYKLKELLCHLNSYLPPLEDPACCKGVCFDTRLVSHRGPSVLVPTSIPVSIMDDEVVTFWWLQHTTSLVFEWGSSIIVQ